MKKAQEFKIYLISVSAKDQQLLQHVLRISSGSARQYVLTTDGSISDPRKIFVVNSDSDEAIAHWVKHYMDPNKKPRVPTVFVGKRKVKADGIYYLESMMMASKVLKVFDTITIKEMNYIPELIIGNDNEDSNVSNEMLEAIAGAQATSEFGFTAMVVDDSQPVRKQLEIELKMLGVKVELAENGEQALALSRDGKYDIIFLDVVMPGIDGYKVCKTLKKATRYKNTPVIMLTGKSSPFDKVKGTLSGCDTYLTKPLQHEDFQSVARKYIPQASV